MLVHLGTVNVKFIGQGHRRWARVQGQRRKMFLLVMDARYEVTYIFWIARRQHQTAPNVHTTLLVVEWLSSCLC